MLNNYTGSRRIIIVTGATDMRKGIDGLISIVQNQFSLELCDNVMFMFCGRKSDRIKVLCWESDGFLLMYKRLEKSKFQWPRTGNKALNITPQQFRWLMEGLKIDQPKAHKRISKLKFN